MKVAEILSTRAEPALRGVTWGLLALLLGVGFFAVGRASTPAAPELSASVQRLSYEVGLLREEHAMPAMVLTQHRDSICYLQGTYSFGSGLKSHWREWPTSRTRFSGTGFVVERGLMATNRHVAEPWFDDPESEEMLRRGARPRLESLQAYCPNIAEPFALATAAVSHDADIALVQYRPEGPAGNLRPLPLAETAGIPGDPVVVVGYPMGVTAMVAKSPRSIYRRLSEREDENEVAVELAALSLIRPSVTHGHLGDIVSDKLIYDAATAHGGSGGPVFNARGKVIGVNAAYLDGFSGSSLGISVKALRPLLQRAKE